jgi:Tol biopolymer transport system component
MFVSGKERIMKTVTNNQLEISRVKEPLHIGLVALLLIVLWSQTALAQPCGITQITNGDTFGAIIQKNNASINADGTRIAFHLDADLTGGNADRNVEIFLFDSNTNIITQVTNTTSGTAPTNYAPSINADGTRVAFESTADLTGGNPELNREIFLYDSTAGTFTQLTENAGIGQAYLPSINADGTRIAFESNANPTGENPNGNYEIYLIDTTDNTITQVTNSPTTIGSFNAAINADGTYVAFDSDEDLIGGNPDFNREIFLFNIASNTTAQLTNSTGSGDNVGSFAPTINANGTRIAFHSNRDLTGGNADSNTEIFLFDTTAGTLTQITNSTEGAPLLENRFASINADGTIIVFVSGRNLSGNNPDTTLEIFSFNTTTNAFTQVTNTIAGESVTPSINADGTRIAFVSRADQTGGNSDGFDELFLASCGEPAAQ